MPTPKKEWKDKTDQQLRAEFFSDLVDAIGTMEGASKDSKNPHFRSDFASLASVTGVSKPVLHANNMALLQEPVTVMTEDHMMAGVKTHIIHRNGSRMDFDASLSPMDKKNAQGKGSCISYEKRYTQQAILDLPSVDDDGEAAVGRASARKPPQVKMAAAPPPPKAKEGTFSAEELNTALKLIVDNEEKPDRITDLAKWYGVVQAQKPNIRSAVRDGFDKACAVVGVKPTEVLARFKELSS